MPQSAFCKPTVSFDQQHLLCNSVSLGKVCIATTKKKNKKAKKRHLHTKFREEAARSMLYYEVERICLYAHLMNDVVSGLFSAETQHRELTEAVCPVDAS